MDESWTIAELAELAAEALGRPGTVGADALAGSDAPDDGFGAGSDTRPGTGLAAESGTGLPAEPGRANGRVRDVPNERLIRWYGTVGLVDPPLSRRGRVARYGRRHLLQLVAVKRRQAEGKSLAEIQQELAGATDEALAAVARIPALGPALALGGDSGSPAFTGGPVTAGTPAAVGPGRFWARQPRQAIAGMPSDVPADASPDGPGTAGGVPVTRLVHGIRLAPGVVLLIDGADTAPGPADMTALADAARPLLTELARRGLGASGPDYLADMDNPQTGAGYEH
jgi:hypothetical protein